MLLHLSHHLFYISEQLIQYLIGLDAYIAFNLTEERR